MSEQFTSGSPAFSAFPAAPPVAAPDESPAADDGFDRERVLRLLDQLEIDVAAVEAAMVHAEAGDHEAFAAAVAPLAPTLAD